MLRSPGNCVGLRSAHPAENVLGARYHKGHVIVGKTEQLIQFHEAIPIQDFWIVNQFQGMTRQPVLFGVNTQEQALLWTNAQMSLSSGGWIGPPIKDSDYMSSKQQCQNTA